MKERRGQKRFKRRFMVRYGERELSHTGFTQDVSRGGAFIVSPYRPPLDTHIHVQVYLEKESSVYFEASVRRHKIVPAQLRSVEKGGFGVRFLLPDEVLANVLVESGGQLEIGYATAADLKKAFDQEFRHGGVFVSTNREVDRGGDAIFAMRLDFAGGRTFEFETTVVHVFQEGGQSGRQGVGLVFKDRKEVEEAISPYLTGAKER
jgi:Tfp pilus assembly protein PilZ